MHLHVVVNMRKIEVIEENITLTDEVELFYEKRVTPFGTGAKVDVPKKYIGRRAYVIILKED
jgi:putative transposon-encoded protein